VHGRTSFRCPCRAFRDNARDGEEERREHENRYDDDHREVEDDVSDATGHAGYRRAREKGCVLAEPEGVQRAEDDEESRSEPKQPLHRFKSSLTLTHAGPSTVA
jgi:hypothetical protein